MTTADRFWSHVEKIPEHTCWEWTASTDGYYGQFQRGGKAHRFSYELHKGSVPDGLDVIHTCKNPTCVNPDHLEVTSHREAIRRGARAIRFRSGMCARGHDLAVFGKTRGDTRHRGSAYRRCMECGRQDARRYGREHRAEITAKRVRTPRDLAAMRAWAKAHPENRVTNESRRRARKAGNGGSHTVEEWLEKCALLGNVCFYCGESARLERDHKVPLSRGGTDNIENIVPACKPCNRRKYRKTALEFIATKVA